MTYADYSEELKQWFVNPQKRKKQFDKFLDRYGVSVEDKDQFNR